MNGCPYGSNSRMIFNNFSVIYKVLNKILAEKQVDNIGVCFHTDLDGIGSAFLIAKILYLIKNKKEISKEEIDTTGLAMLLGEYGDISDNKLEDLQDVLSPKNSYSTGISKKMDIMTKNFGRFLKAIRPVIDLNSHSETKAGEIERLENKLKDLAINYGVGYEEFYSSFIKIIDFFNTIEDIDQFTIIRFISQIVQDPINRIIIDLVQKEIDFMVNSYLRPETPQFDFTVQFYGFDNEDNKLPEYRLFLIDSPLDVGRSVMWTYRGRLQYFKDAVDSKKFSVANYRSIIPEMVLKCKNMCCYNIFSGKLSLQSADNSAFDIGKAFGGGGHGNTGEGSLGSVGVDIEELRKHIKVMEII